MENLPALPRLKYVKQVTPFASMANHYPPKIYKCRDWSKPYHKEIITKKQIHFAHAIKFPDQFDCRFPIDFDFSYETYKRSMEEAVKKEFDLRGIRRTPAKVEEKMQREYELHFGTEDKRHDQEEEYYSWLNSKAYVFSASKHADNMELWKNYGDELRGFCVEFDFPSLVPVIEEGVLLGGDVRYIGDKTFKLKHHFLQGDNPQHRSDLLSELIVDLFTYKYDDYSFENELRFIKVDLADDFNKTFPGRFKFPPFSDKLDIPANAYSAVIFGEDIDPQHEVEIRWECEMHLPGVSFKRALRNGNNLKLELA